MADDRRSRLRAQEDRERFALRQVEERMARDARRLEGKLDRLAADLEEAERASERELRKEHWGHEPERPVAWRDKGGERDS